MTLSDIIDHVDTLKKILIIFFTALISGLFAVCIYNSDLLIHPESRGRTELQADSMQAFDGTERLGFSFGSEELYIRKLYIGIEKEEGQFPVIRFIPDGKGTQTEDPNPYNLDEEVLNIRRSLNGFTLEADNCSVLYVTVVNEFLFDPYVFVFGFFSILALMSLLLFGKRMHGRPQLVFLIIGLCMGCLMCFSIPRDKVGYDEEEHLKAILDMAAYPEGKLYLSDAIYDQLSVSVKSSSALIPGSYEETRGLDEYLSLEGDYVSGEHVFEYDMLKNRAPAYAAMALSMKLGMLLGLSWPAVIIMTRLANLLSFLILVYMAIKKAPMGKWLLLLIGLFPQNIFMASTLSYDPFVTGCLLLGSSYMLCFFRDIENKSSLHGLDPEGIEDHVKPRTSALWPFFWMSLFFLLGCLPKAVYAPMALMPYAGLAALLTGSKGKDEGGFGGPHKLLHSRSWIYLLLPSLLFIGLLASFILPTVISPSSTGDIRGGATSEVSQVDYILGAPLSYAWLLIRQMISWIPQCFIGPDCTTFMGALVSGVSDFRGFYIFYFLLIIFLCVTEQRLSPGKQSLRPGQKLWIFLMIGACSVLIWTSMYVAFTVPGSDSIAGVQGRYFIPLMFPLYLLFYPSAKGGMTEKTAKLERPIAIWYYFMMIMPLLLLSASIWTGITARCCL